MQRGRKGSRAKSMYNVIVNPLSGGGKRKKLIARVEELFRRSGRDFRIFETEKRGQASFLAHELTKEGACDLIVVGGDGTLHEALNGFADFENCNLGLIPAGTGNDFAAAAKIPADPERAVGLILNTRPKPTDFMQMEGCAASTSSVRASTWKYSSAAALPDGCAESCNT